MICQFLVDHHHLLFWNNLFRKQPGADLDEEKGFVVCGKFRYIFIYLSIDRIISC